MEFPAELKLELLGHLKARSAIYDSLRAAERSGVPVEKAGYYEAAAAERLAIKSLVRDFFQAADVSSAGPGYAGEMRVDEVIECLPTFRENNETAKELMAAMPNAYEDHADDPDGEAGRNEWPEADSHADRKLSRVWAKLTDACKRDILTGYSSEHLSEFDLAD